VLETLVGCAMRVNCLVSSMPQASPGLASSFRGPYLILDPGLKVLD
jgi:hypothetical protein